MGLNINTLNYHGSTLKDYERLGSYSRIHVLRKWLLEHEEGNSEELVNKAYDHFSKDPHDYWEDLKIEKYPVFINHNDSEGGYISFSDVGIKGTKDTSEWNDLDILKKELLEMKNITTMPEEVRQVFQDFWNIVNPEDEKSVFVVFC